MRRSRSGRSRDCLLYTSQARPFGATQAAEWSQVALSAASIAFAFLEPDPTIDWNNARLADARRALGSLGRVRI